MYVKITNGSVDTYPYTIGQLRRDNPNTSFPKQVSESILESYGIYSVTISEQPSYTERTETVNLNSTPTLVEGEWTIGWTVSNKSSEEIAEYDAQKATDNRSVRDYKLLQTDWWASSDLTMTAEQTAYRQALRDITTHANWPNLEEADWPTKP